MILPFELHLNLRQSILPWIPVLLRFAVYSVWSCPLLPAYQPLGEKLLLEYCKTGSIVMFFSEGQTKFGDFTFARGEECLDTHLVGLKHHNPSVCHCTRRLLEEASGILYMCPKNGKLQWGGGEQAFTSLVSKLQQMVLKLLHQQWVFVFCRDPCHHLNLKTKQTVGVLLLSRLCRLLAVRGNEKGGM